MANRFRVGPEMKRGGSATGNVTPFEMRFRISGFVPPVCRLPVASSPNPALPGERGKAWTKDT